MFDFNFNLILRNKKVFQHYNRLRRQTAYAQDPEKASVAFEIIPALLCLNEIELPGFVSGGDSACGIYGVGSSYYLQRVIHDYFPETKKRPISCQRYLIKRPLIESLFMLGSIGTVAQTSRSDFDFWVCVDMTQHPREVVEKLEEKAARIRHWCRSTFDMDVHFFILDLQKIRENDFGKVDEESSGSTQKNFLKEECYRTLLLVSGKIPFWWVLPSGIGNEDYLRSWRRLVREAPLDYIDFVDLGFLSKISRGEFLGNALWQLSKGIKDPFKALLKMAMMEVYLSDSFQGPLLCEVLKKRVLEGTRSLREMDPYLLMVETVLDFYSRERRQDQVRLLRKAFYLKSHPKITRTRVITSGGDYKVEVFKDLMQRWKWPLDLMEDLNQIENWSYGRQLRFSKEINTFFSSTYRRLSESFQLKEKQVIDDYDLTLLGRKLLSLFARRKNKLRLTPFLTSKRLILERCVFQYRVSKSGQKQWLVYDASWYFRERRKRQWKIFSSESVVRAAAWLLNNGLYDSHRTIVEMIPNASGVTLTDLEYLLRHLQSFFQPAYYYLSDGSGLKAEAAKDRIMAVVDMEEISKLKRPRTMDLVYRNTWGEMFTETHPYKKGVRVLKDYAQELGVESESERIFRVAVHLPESVRDPDLASRIYHAVYREVGIGDAVWFAEGLMAARKQRGLAAAGVL